MKIKVKDILWFIAEFLPDIRDEKEALDYEVDETEISQCFATALKALRRIKKLSLNALSEKIDIPNPSISRYENGLVTPTLPQAIKIATFFDLNIELFIYLGLMGTKGADIENLYQKFTEQMKGARKLNRQQRRAHKKT